MWQADITYLPMRRDFMYLFAIIDVYSRKVMAWNVSNTMEAKWCAEVYEDAIKTHGVPEIMNADKGSQFTFPIYTKVSLDRGIKISMDGKGRALDNILSNGFGRSLKREYVYMNPANGGVELYEGIEKYIQFYNQE